MLSNAFKFHMMIKCFKIIVAYSAISLLQTSVAYAQQTTPVKLKTEYLENPIGIDESHPRLSWQLDDNRKGAKQTAFRVLVDRDSISLSQGDARDWNLNWTTSGNSRVTYNGESLQPYTRYYWRVEVKDHTGAISTSQIAFFEMGLMSIRQWKGSWISDVHNINLKPAPYFRREFSTAKKIRTARAIQRKRGE
jgi:alpha-L-rhamnosidase